MSPVVAWQVSSKEKLHSQQMKHKPHKPLTLTYSGPDSYDERNLAHPMSRQHSNSDPHPRLKKSSSKNSSQKLPPNSQMVQLKQHHRSQPQLHHEPKTRRISDPGKTQVHPRWPDRLHHQVPTASSSNDLWAAPKEEYWGTVREKKPPKLSAAKVSRKASMKSRSQSIEYDHYYPADRGYGHPYDNWQHADRISEQKYDQVWFPREASGFSRGENMYCHGPPADGYYQPQRGQEYVTTPWYPPGKVTENPPYPYHDYSSSGVWNSPSFIRMEMTTPAVDVWYKYYDEALQIPFEPPRTREVLNTSFTAALRYVPAGSCRIPRASVRLPRKNSRRSIR